MPQVQTEKQQTELATPLERAAEFLREYDNRQKLAEADVLRLKPGAEVSPEAKSAVENLTKILDLKGQTYDVFLHRLSIRGNPENLGIYLIDRNSGETTKVDFKESGFLGSLTGKRTYRDESIDLTQQNDLAQNFPGVAAIRVAGQLGLDPAKTKVELTASGKPILALTKEELAGVKQVDAKVYPVDQGEGSSKHYKFDRASGKLLRDGEPAPQASGPVYSEPDKKLPPGLGEFKSVTPAKEAPAHIRRVFELAEAQGLKILGNPGTPGRFAIYSAGNGSALLQATIEVRAESLTNGKWQSAIAAQAAKLLAGKTAEYYENSGIKEYLDSGKIPESAAAEFKQDFRTDLNQIFGLPKDAPTQLQTLRPDKGPLAGSVIIVLTDAEGLPISSIRFKKDQTSGRFSVAATAINDSSAAALEAK